jgi:MFS family permease
MLVYILTHLKIGLPSMVVTTGANEMFTGITGVYEVCASLTGAITSLLTPFFAHFISYNRCTMICLTASLLSYVICTLPQPLDDSPNDSKVGPVVGVALAGFVYAFGTNVYMAVAAFFPSEAVLALSAGSGFSVIVGPALYIAFMAAFNQDWRRTFLVFLPTALGIPIVWLALMDKSCLTAAEKSRLGELERKKKKKPTNSGPTPAGRAGDVEAAVDVHTQEFQISQERRNGFGSHRTRTGLLFKVIIPKYVLPLIICTSSAIITLLGTSPTLQALKRFRARPQGDLQFQLVCKLFHLVINPI